MHWETNKGSLIMYYLELKPDLILINSHGLQTHEQLNIPGYKIYKINSTNERNDGSAIAIKHEIPHKIYDDYDTDVIATEIETTLGPIIVATTYLPPRRPFLPFPDFYRLLNNSTPTYIIGDLNGNHRQFGNHSNNTVGKSLIQLIDQGILMHLGPQFPTFIRQDAATSPDKIFANKHHFLNHVAEQGGVTSSDHIPIVFKLSTKPILIQQPQVYRLNKANWNIFQQTLDTEIQLTDLNQKSTQEIENNATNLFETIHKAMEAAIPKSTYKRVTQLNITPEIIRLQAEFQAIKLEATTNGWTVEKYVEYRRMRMEIREKCKDASNRKWEDNINNLINISKDSKEFWKKIKLLQGKNIQQANYMKDVNGVKYYTEQEKCSLMENVWKHVFRISEEEEATFDANHSRHIENHINVQQQRLRTYDTVDLNRLDTNNILTRKIEIEDVEKLIKKTKKKAPGQSKISKAIMEKLTKKALQQITNIYNACLATGYFPTILKKAVIKFIPKENKSPTEPLNYRPISLLELPGKLLEKIILQKLNIFLATNNIIKDRQHGFRPQRGTTTAIAVIYETIANALAERKQIYVILRDVSKAFDKVWHAGLQYKILRLGLPPTLEKILCNFLANRTAKIVVGNTQSNEIQLKSGVPQGSVLSPVLYTIYTNDMPIAGPGCTDIMYADDITQIITTESK